jgi:hypothetical protein
LLQPIQPALRVSRAPGRASASSDRSKLNSTGRQDGN